MKRYHVIIEQPALDQIEHYYRRAVEAGAGIAADRWFNRLHAAILALSTLPTWAVSIPEQADFAEPLRQLIFERRYRVIFTVAEESVHVLCVRGLGLPPLQVEDISFGADES